MRRGAISWCLVPTVERVKVVVPVCQSGRIEDHVRTNSGTLGSAAPRTRETLTPSDDRFPAGIGLRW
jgi:hypothetical protein